MSVWEALSFVSMARDGTPMSENRARMVLRQIGLKRNEMDEPYPKESINELFQFALHPEKLDAAAKEAGEWMVARN